MKTFWYLTLLVGVCSCVDNKQEASHNYWKEYSHSDKEYGLQKQGKIRPCSVHDVKCISQFFQHNLHCSAAPGRAPDPVLFKIMHLNMPHVNITYTKNNVEVKGFNDWEIGEFYIDEETDILVFEVQFKRLRVNAHTVITYHRKGEVPLKAADYMSFEYNPSLTLTISNIRKGGKQDAYVFAYVTKSSFDLGPNILENKDPYIQMVNSFFISRFEVTLREAHVTLAPMYMSEYLQSFICNYRINPEC